jgi:hypothetical protein
MTHPLAAWFAAEILPHARRFRFFSADTAGRLEWWIDAAWFADAEAVPYEAQPDAPLRGPSLFVVLEPGES